MFSPDLAGVKLNHPGLQKLQKARQLVPFGIDIHLESMGLFLYFLTEKLPAKDRAAFIKTYRLEPERKWTSGRSWKRKRKKLEKDLKSAKLQKPSKVYQVLSAAPGDQILFLLAHSSERLVHDRIKNYLGEISAHRAGGHRARCAGHRREAGHAQVPEGARGADSHAAGCASEEDSAA